MKTLKLKSPGKLNLRLDVLGLRKDGYHDLRMLNSAIAIYDDVELEIVDRGIEVFAENDPTVPSGEANIAYRVTKEIMAYSNKNVGIRIRIHKRIPSGAGMGGGSSNAASVLIGLNQLLKINLSKEKLMSIGLRFGSDIPFFLYGFPAIATGIGEQLVKVNRIPKMPILVVWPKVQVLTKGIYEKFQQSQDGNADSKDVELPREFSTKKAVVKYLNNDLETVTTRQVPVVTEIKEALMKAGALGAQMTGSGPSVFGIFQDKTKAERAYKKISDQKDWEVFLTENV